MNYSDYGPEEDQLPSSKQSAPRAFSDEQLEYIARREKECADAGCDDNGHKCIVDSASRL